MSPALFDRIAPALFVLIWSTGWISAGFAARTSDPLTFLSVRYALAAVALAAIALAAGARWPRGRALLHGLVSGVLLHAIYLGGVWWAIRAGLPTAVSGLLAAIQPILTALLAPRLIGEPITARQWAGVLAGLAGLALVLAPKLAGVDAATLS
ncbi:MAG: EamA family transporter, partial [Methylobacteriaceae bacterium]|nr:EamA family transporter [Methylobacteriaceae bacterium]